MNQDKENKAQSSRIYLVFYYVYVSLKNKDENENGITTDILFALTKKKSHSLSRIHRSFSVLFELDSCYKLAHQLHALCIYWYCLSNTVRIMLRCYLNYIMFMNYA